MYVQIGAPPVQTYRHAKPTQGEVEPTQTGTRTARCKAGASSGTATYIEHTVSAGWAWSLSVCLRLPIPMRSSRRSSRREAGSQQVESRVRAAAKPKTSAGRTQGGEGHKRATQSQLLSAICEELSVDHHRSTGQHTRVWFLAGIEYTHAWTRTAAPTHGPHNNTHVVSMFDATAMDIFKAWIAYCIALRSARKTSQSCMSQKEETSCA